MQADGLMPKSILCDGRGRLASSAGQTLPAMAALRLILLGVVLLSGLLLEFMPVEAMAARFGRSALLNTIIDTRVGRVAAGHPVTRTSPMSCWNMASTRSLSRPLS
jgi:hypothetical protein